MRAPISVRLRDGVRDEHVTADVSNLTMRKEVGAGHHSASFNLNAPLDKWDALGPNDLCDFYDARNAATLFSGYTQQPTPTRGRYGESFAIDLLGGASQTEDRPEKLPYLRMGADHWSQEDLLTQLAEAAADAGGNYPTGSREGRACLRLQFPNGQALVTGSEVGLRDTGFTDSIMVPGAFLANKVAGITSTDPRLRIYGDVSAGTPFQIADAGLSTTAADFIWFADPTLTGAPAVDEWPYDTASLAIALNWQGGASTVATDTVWVGIDPPILMAQLLDKSGVRIDMSSLTANYGTSSPAYTAWLYAHQIAADLVGRLMPFVDPARATFATSTYPIDQFSFPNPTTAASVLAALARFEPDFFHWIGARGSDLRHSFEWREWPTTARYVMSINDGFVRPGGEVPLCNQIKVYWRDEKGKDRMTVVTTAVPDLDTPSYGRAARTRDAEPITLDDGIGSDANATQIGTAMLAQANRGTTAGQIVFKRPVWDNILNRHVDPWEVEPGCLVMVSEIRETHRLTATDYSDADCQTVGTLGDPVRTLDQLVADAYRRGRTTAKASR